MNGIKTFLLLTALTLLFIFVGAAVGGQSGMVVAFVMACLMNAVSYWFSDKIVLAIYRAKEVTPQEAPELHVIVRQLCEKAALPLPKICIIPSEVPNAFATGRDPHHAVVAVTQGILKILNRDELAGVLAHELSHVRHRDILISSIAATLAGAISMLANMARWGAISGHRSEGRRMNPAALILVTLLLPFAAMLIQLAVSRSREFAADQGGASLLGDGEALASALLKLEQFKRGGLSDQHPSTAHLFIVNPLSADAFLQLFSTHPPTQERVARLRRIS